MSTQAKQDFSFEDFFKILQDDYDEMIKPNIMIIGKTGVGKSTLVNAVFREDIAKTGVGRPVTPHLYKYTKDTVPVNLYDTRGIELDESVQEKIKDEIVSEIEKGLQGSVGDHIHTIWFCISQLSARIEEVEIEWIKDLSKKAPVVLVLTQCINGDDKFYNEVKNLNLPVRNIVRTLAAPMTLAGGGFTIPPYGLKELVDVTFQILPDAVKNAFANAQKVDINKKVDCAWKWASGFIATSFGVGFTPIPFSDAPVIAGIQLTMIARITNIFGFPFSRALLQTIIASIAGSGGASVIGRMLVANLLKLFPAVGTAIGGTISGTVASLLTTALAKAYISVCVKLSSISNINELSHEEIINVVKEEFEKELKNKKK